MARFNILFTGAWSDHSSFMPAVDGEESAYVQVSDEGDKVYARAGCKHHYLSHLTAAKLGLALLGAAHSAKLQKQRYALQLRERRTESGRVITLEGSEVQATNGIYQIDGRNFDRNRWDLRVVPNEQYDLLDNPAFLAARLVESGALAMERLMQELFNNFAHLPPSELVKSVKEQAAKWYPILRDGREIPDPE